MDTKTYPVSRALSFGDGAGFRAQAGRVAARQKRTPFIPETGGSRSRAPDGVHKVHARAAGGS